MTKIEKLNAIKRKFIEDNLTHYRLAKMADIVEPTIKRIITGETKNPNERTINVIYEALFSENKESVKNTPSIVYEEEINANFIEHHIRRKGWTIEVASEKLGVNKNTIVNWKKGRVPIPSSKHNLIRKVLAPAISPKIPFYNIDVTATIMTSFEDFPESIEYEIDFPEFNDCIAALPVIGDSMYPEFKNGDIIAVKPAPTTHFEYGAVHLIITSEGFRTIKRLRKHKNSSKVVLQPSNDRFDEATINKEDIKSLYLVKGQFKKHVY